MTKVSIFSMCQKVHKQVSTRHTTSMSLPLPPTVTKSCSADVVTLTPTHAPFLTPTNLSYRSYSCSKVQRRLCLHLCELTQVSGRSPSNIHRVCSWQTQSQQRSHGGRKRRKEEKKKLASDGGCRVRRACKAWRED